MAVVMYRGFLSFFEKKRKDALYVVNTRALTLRISLQSPRVNHPWTKKKSNPELLIQGNEPCINGSPQNFFRAHGKIFAHGMYLYVYVCVCVCVCVCVYIVCVCVCVCVCVSVYIDIP